MTVTRNLNKFLFFIFATNLVVAAAQAETPTDADFQRIERYLNSLQTIQSKFVQNNPDGSFALGTFYLQRPGLMRFEYDPPIPIRLYADGNFFIHVDMELEQVSHYPLNETPAHFILREKISLRKELKVKKFQRANSVIRIELTDAQNPDIGSVTLALSDNPLELRSWTITDAQGLQTELAFVEARFGGQIDPSLFEYVDKFEEDSN
tara:strand:+ start:8926 stop:9546 length:621 start_codon:yes stop_codon:yes gene_type:complete